MRESLLKTVFFLEGQPWRFLAIDKDGTRSIEFLKRDKEKPEAETAAH